METLDEKRARLRRELRQAYSAWMLASEEGAMPAATAISVDISGCADAAKAKWFAYLAAKDRLVAAYAEAPLAA